jgi:very-short-patch-repair endonuclease
MVEVSVATNHRVRRRGFRVHRRVSLRPPDLAVRENIPVTAPVRTLVDISSLIGGDPLERIVNEADRLDLVDPVRLRGALEDFPHQPGVARLRALLDRRTFQLTDSELERRFLALVAAAGLPMPLSRQRLNGFRVDFYWPDLGLVVETDGLRYHRTPAAQARDHARDQAHTAAGLTTLRFTHGQVRFEPDRVARTLATVIRRLEAAGRSS